MNLKIEKNKSISSLIQFTFLVSTIGPMMRFISAGSVNLSALLSVTLPILVFGIILYSGVISKKLLIYALPIIIMSIMSFGWDIINIFEGDYILQNTSFVLMGFASFIFLPTIISLEQLLLVIDLSIKRSSYLYIFILTYIMLTYDQDPASTQIGVLFFCYHLYKFINHRNKLSLLILFVIFVETFILDSKIISLAELTILSIVFGAMSLKRPLLVAFIVTLFATSIYIYIMNSGFLDRISTGDDRLTLLGYSINTSGRMNSWSLTFFSSLEHLWFGNGHSVPDALQGVPGWNHPHNDYLRFFHQLGLVGLFLWLFFIFRILQIYKKVKKKIEFLIDPDAYRQHQILLFTTAFYFLGILIMMLTDNSIVYSYVTYPLGILIGYMVKLKNDPYSQMQYNAN
ncbi:MAG: O-antigen ligase family protein [Alphaproteobacteria bacterium]|nr:O-antigen ligase family protein [Alphaproteobacteria bacterium]